MCVFIVYVFRVFCLVCLFFVCFCCVGVGFGLFLCFRGMVVCGWRGVAYV